MPGGVRIPRPVLWTFAAMLSLAMATYSVLWIGSIGRAPVRLGIDQDIQPDCCIVVNSVKRHSPADRAGLRPGDRIVAVNKQSLSNRSPFPGYPFYRSVAIRKAGDVVFLTVRRAAMPEEFVARAVLMPENEIPGTGLQSVVTRLLTYYPLLFLVVGVLVVFLRVEDRNAWLLGALFAAFIASAPFDEARVNPAWRGFAIFYRESFNICAGALFYFFFAVFPVSSPIDRKFPNVKWICLAISGALGLVFGTLCFIAGDYSPEIRFFGWLHRTPLSWIVFIFVVALFLGGFASLIGNSVWPQSSEARRKTRVIVWGTLVGFGPAFLVLDITAFSGKQFTDAPFWVWSLTALAVALMPASYAYAVIKDRVLDIPILLKRSARYFMVQRGFVVLMLLFEAYLVFWVFTD